MTEFSDTAKKHSWEKLRSPLFLQQQMGRSHRLSCLLDLGIDLQRRWETTLQSLSKFSGLSLRPYSWKEILSGTKFDDVFMNVCKGCLANSLVNKNKHKHKNKYSQFACKYWGGAVISLQDHNIPKLELDSMSSIPSANTNVDINVKIERAVCDQSKRLLVATSMLKFQGQEDTHWEDEI